MKRYVTVAGIFGASKWTNLRRASGAPIVEWASRLSSNTGILSAFRGKATLTRKLYPSQSMKGYQFFREFGTAVISTASIRSI
jgi:hypothetical protein